MAKITEEDVTTHVSADVSVSLTRQDLMDLLSGNPVDVCGSDVRLNLSHTPSPLEYLESLPENQPKDLT